MSTEFTFLVSNSPVEEPKQISSGSSFSVTVRNTGLEIGTELGFYIRPATDNGEILYPSGSSNQINYYDLVRYGNEGYGITITQGITTTRITEEKGCFASNKIILSIGSGTNGDQLEIGAEIEITLDFDLPPATPSKNLYVDLVIE